MGKAKREASARADELLKSYNVKLNPLAGTYRLSDKATGKEVNVERSGVDVGTGILAKGRRMNRLIGKNLVQKGSYANVTEPTTTTTNNNNQGNTTTGNSTIGSVPTTIKSPTIDIKPLSVGNYLEGQRRYGGYSNMWDATNPSNIEQSRYTEQGPSLDNNHINGVSNVALPSRAELVARQIKQPGTSEQQETVAATESVNNDKNLLSELENYLEYKTHRNPYPSREAREAHKAQLGITTKSPEFVTWLSKKQESQAMPSLSIY